MAAIVTYNRCELLDRCLAAILSQDTPPDHILVINNSSTDGTIEMLQSRGIDYITQENSGSAGGWHTALNYASQHNFDYCWLMDDDGFPDKQALCILRKNITNNTSCLSSVVLQENDTKKFVFPFPKLKNGLPIIFGLKRKLSTLEELNKKSSNGHYPFVHLFNGALISIKAFSKIGNINKDYFIMGDEVDYFFRLRKFGYVASVLAAKHYHPDVTKRPYTKLKIYYLIKNTLIIHNKYFDYPLIRSIAFFGVMFIRVLRRNGLNFIIKNTFSSSSIFLKPFLNGIKNSIGKDDLIKEYE